MPNPVAAVVQLTSTADVEGNLERAAALCARAQARGAELCALPENFALLSAMETDKLRHAAELPATSEVDGGQDARPGGLILERMRRVAREERLHLFLGGMPERGPDPGRVYNSCVHLTPEGRVAAVYRKIHLFDVELADGTTLRESQGVAGGDAAQAVVAQTPFGGAGLSVCYDLRFPELYRRLGQLGARMLLVPSAFTLHTGKDHWHVLLRARAIENQCFVLAPAQQGRHHATRQTYGHSLIVDPWGTVLAECPDGEGVALAELDMDRLERVRRELPCLQHRRIA